MKRLLFVLLPLLLVGGGVYGMMRFGIPPFKPNKPNKSNAKNAKNVTAARAEPSSTPAEEPAVKVADTPPADAPISRPRRTHTDPEKAATPDPQAEARIARLTQVYEQMPVEDAARIMAKLPDPLVEKLLRRMDERQTGKILLAFDVNRAAKLTLALSR